MGIRNKFDTIADSITNGQRRQAYRQMNELDADELCEMIDYFARELSNIELSLDAAKTFIRQSTRNN
jgi:hypothetical protein